MNKKVGDARKRDEDLYAFTVYAIPLSAFHSFFRRLAIIPVLLHSLPVISLSFSCLLCEPICNANGCHVLDYLRHVSLSSNTIKTKEIMLIKKRKKWNGSKLCDCYISTDLKQFCETVDMQIVQRWDCSKQSLIPCPCTKVNFKQTSWIWVFKFSSITQQWYSTKLRMFDPTFHQPLFLWLSKTNQSRQHPFISISLLLNYALKGSCLPKCLCIILSFSNPFQVSEKQKKRRVNWYFSHRVTQK